MKLTNLKGKKCLITGASRGVGKAIADMLYENGVKLCVSATSEESFTNKKNDIHYVYGDLTKPIVCKDIVTKANELLGGIDYVINNAGLAYAKPTLECDVDDWDSIMNLNARAPFIICKEATQYIKKSDTPTIINISSILGKKGYENQSIYSASKHALEGFTKAYAKEVKKNNIRVHIISPGGILTEMVRKTRPDLDTSVLIEAEEIADLIVFLLTRRNNGVIEDVCIRRDANLPFK